MAIYSLVDLASNFSGDICIADNGDLEIANALDTTKAAANFILRTDYGDYSPNQNVGSNLGDYIGEPNTSQAHTKMELSVRESLVTELFDKSDVTVDVVPFDLNEALVMVNLAGYYLIDNEITYVEEDRLAFTFPYIEGSITPLTING